MRTERQTQARYRSAVCIVLLILIMRGRAESTIRDSGLTNQDSHLTPQALHVIGEQDAHINGLQYGGRHEYKSKTILDFIFCADWCGNSRISALMHTLTALDNDFY